MVWYKKQISKLAYQERNKEENGIQVCIEEEEKASMLHIKFRIPLHLHGPSAWSFYLSLFKISLFFYSSKIQYTYPKKSVSVHDVCEATF